MGADRRRPARRRSSPCRRAQRLPASSISARGSDLGQQLAEERARLAPGLRPADALRAALVAGAARELAQVGDHAGGVDRAAGGQAGGSRRSAWARQWAPPPPSVNISRSGASTSRPCARICSFSARAPAPVEAPGRRRATSRSRRARTRLRSRPRGSRSPCPRSQRDEAARDDARRRPRPASGRGSRRGRRCGRRCRGSARPAPPSPRPRSSRRAAGPLGLGPLLAVADQRRTPGSTIITSPPSIAPAVIISRIGIPFASVEADHRGVLAAAPLLLRRGDERRPRASSRSSRARTPGRAGRGRARGSGT